MLARELRRIDRLALGPGVPLRNDDLKRLLVEKFGRNAGRLKRQRDDGRVDAAGLERGLELLGDVLLDFERHVRRSRVKRRDEVRQKIRRHRVDRPEAEQACQLVAARLRDIANSRRFLQHLVRLLNDALADRRHRDLAFSPLEELRLKFFLQFLDRHRQGGLADKAALRGPAEAFFLRDGDDVAKLVERHCRRFKKLVKFAPTSGCLTPSSTVASRYPSLLPQSYRRPSNS